MRKIISLGAFPVGQCLRVLVQEYSGVCGDAHEMQVNAKAVVVVGVGYYFSNSS